MAKKKSLRRAKPTGGSMPPLSNLQGIGRKRVSAVGASGCHPCPRESPLCKKKSLSQFVSPSSNSNKRMHATIVAARESKRAVKKPRGDGKVAVPVLEASAFQHVLALDTVLRAANEARVNSLQNSPVVPSAIHAVQHVSPIQASTMQGLGVHVHIYVSPSQAPKENRQEDILVGPLVRVRRILEFRSTAPLSEVGQDVAQGSQFQSPTHVEPNTISKQLENLELQNQKETSPEVTMTHATVPSPRLVEAARVVAPTAVEATRVVGSQGLLPVTNDFEGIAQSPQKGEETQIPEYPSETAIENQLNSTKYDEEESVERDPICALPSNNYSEEFVMQLLSLLLPHEREAFVQTHQIAPIANRSLRLPTTTNALDLPKVEVPQVLPADFDGSRPSSPKSLTVLLSSTHSDDVRKEKLVNEVQFNKTLRQLAWDERKYKKKQAKKLAKAVQDNAKVEAVPKEINARSSVKPNPPLALVQQIGSLVGPNSRRQKHAGKEVSPSSAVSSDTPSSLATLHSVDNDNSVAVVSSWDVVDNILPFEVNTLTAPTGEFWEHMRRYALEQAPFEFPWHLDWNKQKPKLKAHFTLKLRKVYRGPWNAKNILRAIGANLREHKTRLKRKLEKAKKMIQVSQPYRCSKGSWRIIYESTKDAMKQRKAKLCKEAVDKRFKLQGPTHQCGPRGIKGVHDRFVDHFNRPPTDEELEYGKINGWSDLKLKIEKALGVLNDTKGIVVGPRESPLALPATTNPDGEDAIKVSSSTSDTSSSGTSSDFASDGDTSTSESEED